MAIHRTERNSPDEPTIQEVMEEIDNLRGMLGNILDGITSLRKSVGEIKEAIAQLPDDIDRS
jgi:hypothetical protein